MHYLLSALNDELENIEPGTQTESRDIVHKVAIVCNAGYQLYEKVKEKIFLYIAQIHKETNDELQKMLSSLQSEFDKVQSELRIRVNMEYKEYVKQKHYEHNSEWIMRVKSLKKQYDTDRTKIINANSSDIIAKKQIELKIFKQLKEDEYDVLIRTFLTVANNDFQQLKTNYITEQKKTIATKRDKVIDNALKKNLSMERFSRKYQSRKYK